MTVVATAPGKLLLAGEYAVLEGAPALVLALDCQARVTVETAAVPLLVRAPELGITAAQANWQDGRLCWQQLTVAQQDKLRLVTCLLEALAQESPLPPMQLALDTSAFFAPDGRTKLGFGSSAALTVALTQAVTRFTRRALPDLAALLAMHRAFQDGRGSGVDVAASLVGGALLYQLVDGVPLARSVTLPDTLLWRVVWSGKPASTHDALRQLSEWRQRAPAPSAVQMRQLEAAAGAVATAVETQDAETLLARLQDYGRQLDAFGQAAGIDIVSAGHRRLTQLATQSGVVYKPSGAGGGDIGVAFATDVRKMADFLARAAAANFAVLDVQAG